MTAASPRWWRAATQGAASVGGRPVAYQRLQRQAHNANDWYVLAAARAPVGPLYGVSGWSVALVVVALVLLVFAATPDCLWVAVRGKPSTSRGGDAAVT